MNGSRIFLAKELAGGVSRRQAKVTVGEQLETAVFGAFVDRDKCGQ